MNHKKGFHDLIQSNDQIKRKVYETAYKFDMVNRFKPLVEKEPSEDEKLDWWGKQSK